MKTGCSIRELADYLSLSTCTVSKALNDADYPVSPKTRSRILEAAAKFEYQPNINAKRLFANRTDVIGLVTPSHRRAGFPVFSDQHLTHIISGMEDVFTEKRYRLMVLFNDAPFVEKKEYLSVFRQQLLDGLLIWGAYRDESYWQELIEREYPHVFLTSAPQQGELPFHSVTHDYPAGCCVLMEHLLARGHRRFIWCPSKENSSVTALMQQGLTRALLQAGLDPAESLVALAGEYTQKSGHEIGRRMLSEDFGASAVIAASGKTATGIYEVMREAKVAVPERYAIACCDSLRQEPGGITRVRVDDIRLGRETAGRIIQLIENPGARPEQAFLPVELLIGETT